MPFKLEVIRGSATYDISAGNAIAIEDLDDLGGASVRNQEEQGPFQDGSTHLGERLEARTMTLRLNVQGATDTALDGHRDTLNAMFKPVRGVPIILRITRDDGEIRQIDTRRTGPLNIPLNKMHRPGHYHRAVVQLRAADPLFYDPDEQEEELLDASDDWWLGYDTIGTANVMEHVESPTQGQLWAHSGSVAAGSAYTIAFRGGTAGATNRFAFQAIAPGFDDGSDSYLGFKQTTNASIQQASFGTVGAQFSNAFLSGTSNYFMIVRPGASNGTIELYRNAVLLDDNVVSLSLLAPIQGTAAGTARWRSAATGTADQPWLGALPAAAVYNIALDNTQRASLNDAMAAIGGSAYAVAIAYQGDYDSYPVFTLNGPLGDPVITNTITGDTLDFTGGTVGTGEIWTIDLRYGRKRVVSGTTNITSYLSNDSDLATFRLVPDPIATGGTNTITVSYTANGTASSLQIAYYERYMGY